MQCLKHIQDSTLLIYSRYQLYLYPNIESSLDSREALVRQHYLGTYLIHSHSDNGGVNGPCRYPYE